MMLAAEWWIGKMGFQLGTAGFQLTPVHAHDAGCWAVGWKKSFQRAVDWKKAFQLMSMMLATGRSIGQKVSS